LVDKKEKMNTIQSDFEILIKDNLITKDLGHTVIYKLKDSTLVIKAGDNHMYLVEDIKEIYQVMKDLSGGQKTYNLNVMGEYTSVEPEVRAFSSKGPHKDLVAAECFVISSLAQRILANAYIKINKPIVKSAFFNNINSAKEWLTKQKEYDAANIVSTHSAQ
jgi:hypothetical protein